MHIKVQNSEMNVAQEAAGMGVSRAEPRRDRGCGSADATSICNIFAGTVERVLARHVSGPSGHFEKQDLGYSLKRICVIAISRGQVTEALRRRVPRPGSHGLEVAEPGLESRPARRSRPYSALNVVQRLFRLESHRWVVSRQRKRINARGKQRTLNEKDGF